MAWPFSSTTSIYPTFDTERDWHARERPSGGRKRVRGPDFPYESSPSFEMIDRAVPPLLELLARHETAAIFFVTGEVCRLRSELVYDIYDAGHELGVHTHPQLHPEFRGNHVNDIEHGLLAEYSGSEIRTMIGRDYDDLRDLGIDTVHFRAGTLSFDETVARQVKAVGLGHDHSIRLANVKDVSNLPLYLAVRRLGLDETPVVLNPAFIHEAEHNEIKPHKRLFAAAFDGTLVLHPMVLGNSNVDSDEDWRRLASFAERCTHQL